MNPYEDIQPDPFEDCPRCGGSGLAWDDELDDFATPHRSCERCGGMGGV